MPPQWEHPKSHGRYVPLLGIYTDALARWEEAAAEWVAGTYEEKRGMNPQPSPRTVEFFKETIEPKPEEQRHVPYSAEEAT